MLVERLETYTTENVGFVLAHTDTGEIGIGQFPPRDPDIVASVFHRHIAPRALGDSIDDREVCSRSILESRRSTPGYSARALAGLDTALWDLAGKREGRPVYELLGGTGTIGAYASSMRRQTEPEEEAARLADLVDENGFEAVKLRIGEQGAIGTDADQWPGRTESLVPAVRSELGNGVDIYVDANCAFTPERAIEIGEDILEPNDVAMFEEPCPYWDTEATGEVTDALEVPVAGGELVNDIERWEEIIDRPAVDIIQPDICFDGGFTRAIDLASRAENAGLRCVPHSATHSLNLVFAAHLIGGLELDGCLEYSIDSEFIAEVMGKDAGWDAALYGPNLAIDGGRIEIPDGPGWGVDLDASWKTSADRCETRA